MHLNYFVLATCAVLTVAFPAPKSFATSYKRQAPPDFYRGTAAWYFTLDTAEWFGLADKRDQDKKERERKAREQKERERIEQERREQEKEQERQSKEQGSNPFLDSFVFPEDPMSTVDLRGFQSLE